MVVQLKRVASVRVSNVDKKSVDGEQPVRLCNYTDVYYRDVIRPEQEFMAATATPEQIRTFRLRPNDVVITKDSETADDIGVPAFVQASAQNLVCGYHLAVIRPTSSVLDGRFLFWSIASTTVREQLALAATGVTRYGLRSDSIGSVAIRCPSLPAQRVVADFLDAETARIDALIAKKRHLVELVNLRVHLKAYAMVHQGKEIPLRRLAGAVKTGATPTPAELAGLLDGDTPWLSPGDVGGMLALRRAGRSLHSRAITQGSVPLFPAESTLVVGIGATAGRVAHLSERASGNQQMTCITPNDAIRARFLSWQLWARQEELRSNAPYTTLPIITNDFLRSLHIRVPTIEIQEQVAGRLDHMAMSAGRLVQRLDLQISSLLERRQALITAAVTGELEVPGVAA
jgi:type I restriction enzyme, S subunit